jgi:sugar phosphate permease
MGFYALFATSDSPEKEGYEPVEVIKEKKKDKDGNDGARGDLCCRSLR